MRRLGWTAFLLICMGLRAGAQSACHFGSEEAAKELIKALTDEKSCAAAAARMHDCAWGSSADTQFAPIVVAKCEKQFFDKLSQDGQLNYTDQMQVCAYKYARQQGTLYMSAAALCQVDVAARFAANPAANDHPPAAASFNCQSAHTVLEKAICSNPQLGDADIALADVYAAALKSLMADKRSAVEADQHKWLAALPARCGLAAIPPAKRQVNCLRNQFELRFTALESCSNGDDTVQCLKDADAGSAVAAAESRASFDCENPQSALEIAICADENLGQTDIRLAQAFRSASAKMSAAQRGVLAGSQRKWRESLATRCPLGAVGGIPPVQARACLRGAFEARIGQLQECPRKPAREQAGCLNRLQLLSK